MPRQNSKQPQAFHFEGDPLWYKDAVIYEVHVRAFCDSNDDGIGDFRGLTQKLDHLQDLGVTAIWLLPFYPSPLRDDGYDIADYFGIHPSYGTLRDFRIFMREANRRKLHVITEMVLNHTSDQHPWFQAARMAGVGERARDYYVWSKTTERYQDTRVIFQDFEHSNWTYDQVAGEYFWHRFYSHQPDLNFENPAVRRAMFQVLDYWFEMGVAGMRLDAVPYIFEEEGTNCENLPRTHDFLRELRRHVDRKFRGRMLLAEANMWPEDAAAYFGDGDECHMNFHFPLMPRLFMALQSEDRFPIIDILEQTPEIHETCQWATFLRNHDELTLEMVTDEERDYMYRMYGRDKGSRINVGIRRRLAPLLGNDRRKIEVMYALLFSLPGTPVIYYGDEIGMGDNIFLGDRNGVRTPMQWSADRNAGFSRANPQQLYLPVIADPEYRYEAVNVETQQKNPHSLFWWLKRLIGLRKRYKAFSRGTMEVLHAENRKVLAFVRRHERETVLCVINLSRFVQYLELDLGEFAGMAPVELFSRNAFPGIGSQPYFLTLGPHSFYFFSLEEAHERVPVTTRDVVAMPLIEVQGEWTNVFKGTVREEVERALHDYLPGRRWFGGKARSVKSVQVIEVLPMRGVEPLTCMLLIGVDYTHEESDTYSIHLTWAAGEEAGRVQVERPEAVVARLRRHLKDGLVEEGVVYDALTDRAFCLSLLESIARRRSYSGVGGRMECVPTRFLGKMLKQPDLDLEPSLVKTEQSNSSIIFGGGFVLKMFRRLEGGLNPDLEITRFLTEKNSFANTPRLAGSLQYHPAGQDGEPVTLGLMQEFVSNEGDAWSYTLDELNRYFERISVEVAGHRKPDVPNRPFMELIDEQPPETAPRLIESYLDIAQLLGRRVAEMHLVLGSEASGGDSGFAPERFPPHYQRSLFQMMRNHCEHTFQLLKRRTRDLPDLHRQYAKELLGREDQVMARFRSITEGKISARRIRCHGDLHLGQMLYTGRDFMILDFEGEPTRSLSERRIKRSPLRDVAGMLRSFHYAAYTVLIRKLQNGIVHPENRDAFEDWMRFWYHWTGRAFLQSYLEHVQPGEFLPKRAEAAQSLLGVFLLEKALYELGYELNNRPDWAEVPLKGILQLLDEMQ